MLDTTSLFLHVLAAIGMLAGAVTQALAGARLRVAPSGTALASWADFAHTAGIIVASSAALSLLTGGHLAGAVWGGARGGFENPFITLGMLGLLVLAPVGPLLGGVQLRRLAQAGRELGDHDVPSEVVDASRSPLLWGPVHSLAGVGVGLVALMVYKPSWIVGAAILALTFASGWGVGVALGHASDRRP